MDANVRMRGLVQRGLVYRGGSFLPSPATLAAILGLGDAAEILADLAIIVSMIALIASIVPFFLGWSAGEGALPRP